VLVTSACFGILHLEWLHALLAFVLGCYLGFIVEQSGSALVLADPDLAPRLPGGLPVRPLRDADDSLPQVPWSGVMDEKAAALLAVLEDIAGLKPMGIIHEIGASGTKVDDLLAKARRPTLTDDETLFFIGERPDFRSLVTSQRVVVLTPHEAELARRKFGPLMPLELSLFVLDHAERQGYVIWDAQWRGGTLVLEKSDGRWRVRAVSSWIT